MLWSFVLSALAIGSFTFGGGYAMISALEQDFVARHAWLTPAEFSNGVAIGQLTPGPLMIMIAFMGYKIAGFWGALLGTIALFLPSFVMVLLLSRYLERVQGSTTIRAALKGVNAAVTGLLATAVSNLVKTSISSISTLIIAVLCMLLLSLPKREPVWVLAIAGFIGAVFLR